MPAVSIANPLPRLLSDEVHVWRRNLASAPVDEWHEFLSADEMARAERFHFDHHRERYIASHGWLRKILGDYLRLDPGKLLFLSNEYGKPYLEITPLHFNLSHSGDELLIAVASREVGIDIEKMRENIRCLEIAKSHFSAREFAALQSLPEQERVSKFFDIWTCKEALCKGLGVGIAKDLASTAGDGWSVRNIAAPAGYAAALAMPGDNFKVSYHEAT